MKNCVASLFTFFEKVLQCSSKLNILYRSVFRCKVLKLHLFEVLSTVLTGIFFFAGRKYVDLVVISSMGRGRNFYSIFTKSQKLYLHKIFNIGLTAKVRILRFHTRRKMYITPVLLKSYSFNNFLNTSNFASVCFFSKKFFFHLKKYLCHVYIYVMTLT